MKKADTLVEVLAGWANTQPDKPAFTFLDENGAAEAQLSYSQLNERAIQLAGRLQAVAEPGDRALLLYAPGLDFIIAYMGCLYAGVVAVPAYPPRMNRPMPRIQAIVEDARPKIALTTRKIYESAAKRFEHAPELANLIWINTGDVESLGSHVWSPPGLRPDDLAFLQYTSGSTSTPKGVMISHGNLMANVAMIDHGFRIDKYDGPAVFWLPSYHDMGLIGGILTPISKGGHSMLLSPLSFLQQPARWLEAISTHRGVITGAPNFAFDHCVAKVSDDQLAGLDLSSIGLFFTGAEPIRPASLREFAEKFEPAGFSADAFYPCYGMAETTLLVAGGIGPSKPKIIHVDAIALSKNEVVPVSGAVPAQAALVSCGQALLDETIVIADPDTLRLLPEDRIGEIWVAGRHVGRGYWNRPEDTKAAFNARLDPSSAPTSLAEVDFLRTGDLGFLQAGQLFITGRSKDLLIFNGRNHYPQDIELTIEDSHDALEPGGGAAISVDVNGQERLVAIHEVTRQGRKTPLEKILPAVRRAVAEQHDLPLHALVLVSPMTIPKTSSGKIQRAAAKEDYLSGNLQIVEIAAAAPAAQAPPTSEVERWLVNELARRVKQPASSIDPSEPFAVYGLDSAAAVGMTGDLERLLNRSLEATLAWDYPTPRLLAKHLSSIGDVSALAEENDASADLDSREVVSNEPIAIVGMACRFPGADSTEAFWENLVAGVDSISEVPADRWSLDTFYSEDGGPGRMTTRWGGFLDDISGFDAGFFGISPREASRIDPQQRLLLETAWQAFEDAGIPPNSLSGQPIGVFVGISSFDYSRRLFADVEQVDAYAGTGNAHSVAANRLSYQFNFRGPSLAVDTACSSSLVAIHQAASSLRLGESELALAAGVNVTLAPELTVAFSQAQMMAADGRCKTFDRRADGYVRGEGCGVLVLKRLSDAQRDGDQILATILGSAVNQDGRSNGLTAPNRGSQVQVIQQAQAAAKIGPGKIEYIEAHGTGTPLGDPIEIGALRDVFDGAGASQIKVGSVKTNIGHLESAAGVAGTIKTILALRNGLVPPHLHFETLNPYITLDGSSLHINTEGEAWPSSEAPRYAGISSFGFGGTNAHVILSDLGTGQPNIERQDRRKPVLPISARSKDALLELLDAYQADTLLDDIGANLNKAAQGMQTGREHLDFRLAFAADTQGELKTGFERRTGEVEFLNRIPSQPRIAFLFSGQGSQRASMGHELYQTDPHFRREMDEIAELLDPLMEISLLDVLFESGAAAEDRLQRTEYTQPALFALEVALANYAIQLGIQPDILLGHSIGELAAACVAGVFSLEDGCRLVTARATLMGALPAGGGMLAVLGAEDQVVAELAKHAPNCSIAARNTTQSLTLSGPITELEALVDRFNELSIQSRNLPVSHAFHSNLMEPMLAEFESAAAQLHYKAPAIPLISNTTGELMPPGFVPDASYWVSHIRSTVEFSSGVETVRSRADHYLELGPDAVLSGLVRRAMPAEDRQKVRWITFLKASDSERDSLASALVQLYEAGINIDWQAYQPGRTRVPMALPAYPFQHESYWTAEAPQVSGIRPDFERLAQVATPTFIFEIGPAGQSQWLGIVETALAELNLDGRYEFAETHFFAGPQQAGRYQLTLLESIQRIEFRMFHQSGEDTWLPLVHGVLRASDTQPVVGSTAVQFTLPLSQSNGMSNFRQQIPEEPGIGLEPEPSQASLRDELLGLEASERAQAVADYLRERVGAVLGLRPTAVDTEQGLDRMGIDSLTAVEFRNTIEKELSFNLPITRLLAGPSLDDLSVEIAAGLELIPADSLAGIRDVTPELGTFRLTADQQAMWFLDELMPEGITFNVSGAVKIRGDFEVKSMEQALKASMDRHTMLRTTFSIEDGEPVQTVHERLDIPFAVVDASRMTSEALQLRLTWDAYRDFDLANEPAWRLVIYEINADERLALVAMQHTITDFWSMTVFAAEVMEAYAAFAAGETWTPEPLDIKYSDFVAWETQMLSAAEGLELQHYWVDKLAGPIPELELPKDLPRPPIQTYNGASVSARLAPSISSKVADLAAASSVTEYIVLLSAFKTLLARFTGLDDLVVGSAMSGRNHPELEPLIGYFVNPVALRTDLSGEPAFSEVMARVQTTVLEAFDHQDFPPARIADHIELVRDPSKPPVFSTTFIYQKAQFEAISDLNTVALGLDGATLNMSGLTVESAGLVGTPSQFDLTLMMADTSKGLAANFIYNPDLFNEETIARWAGHYETLLESLTAAPHRSIWEHGLVPEVERLALAEFNHTSQDYPDTETLQSLFETQVEQTPDQTALVFGKDELTYADFNSRANRLAHHLIAQGVGPEQAVGLLLDRSFEMLVGMYAIIKAGGAYLPLDPDYPAERLDGMIADAQVNVILTTERREAQAAGLAADAQVLTIDQAELPWSDLSAENPGARAAPDTLAYIIFTSGSTGRPKGVMNEHAGIVNRLIWMQEAFDLQTGERVLQKTPFSFDVSVWEFFWPLQVGAALVIAEPDGHKDPDYLIQTIQAEEISTIHFVPSMLQAFLQNPDASSATALKRVICSGEALPYDLQERFFESLPAELHNLYGPTEAAVDVSHWVCRPDARQIVPIGHAIANTRLYVLDAHGNELATGIPGELFIGGVQVARGYSNRPGLTAERFIPDPFDPGHRLYRTGDLVKRLDDGSIEFLGRVDFQIKIRGFRVELGEIEAVLLNYPGVREAVVVSHGTGDQQQIAAYHTETSSDEPCEVGALRTHLRDKLPEYMVPSQFISLGELPLLSNGKVNRAALPDPEKGRSLETAAYVAPRSALEERLAQICAEVLDTDRVGMYDHFFDMGGNSLQATRLLYLARDFSKQPIPLRGIFEDPTISGLATLIEGLESGLISPEGGQGLAPLVTEDQLRADIELPTAFSVPARAADFENQVINPDHVLLTGATGFLGAYLLAELLAHTNATIHCIVRAKSPELGLERIQTNYSAYPLDVEINPERLVIYVGDLSSERLGLTNDDFDDLAGKLDVIYHNGAAVNFVAGYEQLKPANVGGAKTLLTLATQSKQKPLHFVSTLGQFNTNVEDDGQPISEIGYPDYLGVPLSGYTQTKWVADRILGLAQEVEAAVNIYRPGIIAGDSGNGAWNHADMVAGLTAASVASGQLPELALAVDFAPVDYVAKAIVHMSLQPELIGTSFHLSNPKPLSYTELIAWFQEIGFPVEIVSFERWRQGLKAIAGQDVDGLWSMYLPLIEEIAEAQVFLPAISTERTRAALTGTQIICPPVDPKLLMTYLSYFAQTGVIAWDAIESS
jgi:amino acid adenylation domain-containing protein/thioester reductase-like protein